MTDLEKIRTKLHTKIVNINMELQSINHLLAPILEILQNHEIPIRSVYYNKGFQNISLPPEAKLTETVYAEIVKFLGFEARQSTLDSYIAFIFSPPPEFKHPHISDTFWCLSISNGASTCKVKEICTERIVQKKETEVHWEPVGDCAPFEEEQTNES